MISVILPAYEQPESVLCALEALWQQTLERTEFEVLIIDDSGDDSVRSVVFPPAVDNTFYFRSSPPRVGRFTAGRARNIGAANARGSLLVFIDQDVMLSPVCLEKYALAYKHHGERAVYLGLYHWMRRIAFDHLDVRSSFKDVIDAGLDLVMDPQFAPLPMDEPGLQGTDMREKDFGGLDRVVADAALGCFSGNIGYPRSLFVELGGFDENIRRHGGEDADLGLTAKEQGASFVMWNAIWGVHIWHSRNQAQNARDVQANIDYIDRKHGIGRYAEAQKWTDARDWTDPIHYRKEAGGVLMKIAADPTYWICREKKRMGVPSLAVLQKMGFRPEDVLTVTLSSLAAYEVMGTAG